MTWEFVEKWKPVFSSREFDHFTLVNNSSRTCVGGKIVQCPNRCSSVLTTSQRAMHGKGAYKVTVRCFNCRQQAQFNVPRDTDIHEDDKEKIIPFTNQDYLRTPYPIPLMPLSWGPLKLTGSSTPSTSHPPLSSGLQETLDVPAPSRSTSLPSSVGTSPVVTRSPTPSPIVVQPVEQPREVGALADEIVPVEIGQRAPRIFPGADRPEKRLRNDSSSLGSRPGLIKKKKSRSCKHSVFL